MTFSYSIQHIQSCNKRRETSVRNWSMGHSTAFTGDHNDIMSATDKHIYVCVCVCVCVYVYICICIYLYICVCMYVCVYIYVFVCKNIYIHIHTHTHTHTHRCVCVCLVIIGICKSRATIDLRPFYSVFCDYVAVVPTPCGDAGVFFSGCKSGQMIWRTWVAHAPLSALLVCSKERNRTHVPVLL